MKVWSAHLQFKSNRATVMQLTSLEMNKVGSLALNINSPWYYYLYIILCDVRSNETRNKGRWFLELGRHGSYQGLRVEVYVSCLISRHINTRSVSNSRKIHNPTACWVIENIILLQCLKGRQNQGHDAPNNEEKKKVWDWTYSLHQSRKQLRCLLLAFISFSICYLNSFK